eukprot:TRINITY_DN12724_c0_g1_i2.p1 TRINITY_DN12724_c0_g1~~TRINITY_DN12724_c0_g1_i2.p1  ORF type:complete len:555 (-),score=120.93 TRINITY_DN12724_c0_g1_i2:58-1722(-)
MYFIVFFFFFKQKTAYEMLRSLVGSEMCIRDRCYSVSLGRIQNFQAYTQDGVVTVGLVFALFHMWETGVCYSARFFEDDVVHRSYFFCIMVLIATATVSVKESTVDLNLFCEHYLGTCFMWLAWYVSTALIVNVALTKPESKDIGPRCSSSDFDMEAALANVGAAARAKSASQSGRRCCTFMRKEALASTCSMGVLFVFTLASVVFATEAGQCGDSHTMQSAWSGDCAVTSLLLILGVSLDKVFISIVWTMKPSWWVRMNKDYIQTRYKRIITMILGTNVVSALLDHAAESGNDASNSLYLIEGILLGLLIVLYYFDLSIRSSKQHALSHTDCWRGVLWLWTHVGMVTALVFWGASKVNSRQQDDLHPSSTIKIAVRSAAIINACLTIQHATHKEEIRASRSRIHKRFRLMLMCVCTALLAISELLLTNDLVDKDETAVGNIDTKAAMAIVIGIYIVLIVSMYWATRTVELVGVPPDRGHSVGASSTFDSDSRTTFTSDTSGRTDTTDLMGDLHGGSASMPLALSPTFEPLPDRSKVSFMEQARSTQPNPSTSP